MQVISKAELKQMWERPREQQINIAVSKILEAIQKSKGQIAVAWSGGKDSTTLLYLTARIWVSLYGDRPLTAVFADTTNEHREIYQFLDEFREWLPKKTGVKLEFIEASPDTTFAREAKAGLPLISKNVSMTVRKLKKYLAGHDLTWADVQPYCRYGDRECVAKLKSMGLNDTGVLCCTGYYTGQNTFGRQYMLPYRWHPLMELDIPISEECCNHLKKSSIGKELAKIGIHSVLTGEMACDSQQRESAYLQTGCVNIMNGVGKAKPMGPMQEQTVLWYIDTEQIPQSSYYGDLVCRDGKYCFTRHQRGGCALCGFGIEHEPDRFMKLYHEDYAKCRFAFLPRDKGGLGYKEACEFLNERCGMKIQIPEIEEG